MEFIKNLHLERASMPKKVALLAAGILGVAIVLSIIKMTLTNTLRISQGRFGSPTIPLSYEGYGDRGENGIQNSAPSFMNVEKMGGLDTSFMPPMPPIPPYQTGITPGSDAEDFEVTSYNASIKTWGESADVCDSLLALKARTDVIFESANQSENGCTYTFKVENKHAQELVDLIKNLDPETLDENTYTVKRTITGYTDEIQILTNKLVSIEATLKQALDAYDEISKIATSEKDTESLAKIIDSKVNLIERLTMEHINVQNQIAQIQRSYSDQLDHLNYTVFTVSVYEQKIIDLKPIGDSWVLKLRAFFIEINGTLQSIILGLLSFIISLAYYALVFIILLFVAKHGWRMTKAFWKS